MTQNMGIGEIGTSDIVFVRDFRFVLKGNYLNESFNKNVKIDYTNKRLIVSIHEVATKKPDSQSRYIHAHDWAENLENGTYQDENLSLTTYDGSGEEIYCKCFKGIKIIGRKTEFDYSSTEATYHVVTVSYESCSNCCLTNTTHETKQVETKVDHLNARMAIL